MQDRSKDDGAWVKNPAPRLFNVKPASFIVTSVDSSLIICFAKIIGRLVMLLDLGKVFTTQEKPELHEFDRSGWKDRIHMVQLYSVHAPNVKVSVLIKLVAL